MTRIGSILAAAAAMVLIPIGAAGAATDDGTLTPHDQEKITELRSCLAPADGATRTLEVYYLTDASGSLFAEHDDHPSDPEFVRADVLGNSLTQVATLPGVSSRYASGYFGTGFVPGTAWTGVTPASGGALANEIRAQESLGSTDWAAGLTGASDAFTAVDSTDGCKLLVWLTDGRLDLGDPADTARARAELKSDDGPLQALDDDDVTTIGVMLNREGSDSAAAADEMRPLVEDTADGIFLNAHGPSDLAFLFMKLGAQLAGGAEGELDADGGFWIDPGVSRFVLASPQSGVLTKPDGTVWQSGASGTEAVIGGATQITQTIDVGMDVGKWHWTGAGGGIVYRFSGLALTMDPENALVVGDARGLEGKVIRVADDGMATPLDLDDYEFTIDITAIDGATAKIGPENVAADGSFTVPWSTPTDEDDLNTVARITDLTTVGHDLRLEDVVSQPQTVKVKAVSAFPTVELVSVSHIAGTHGVAEIEVRLTAPVNGMGSVMLPAPPTADQITDTAPADRSATWDADGPDQTDIELAAGESKVVTYTLANSESANADASFSLDFTTYDADQTDHGVQLDVTVPTTKPFDLAQFGWLLVILLVVGTLLPLAALWAMNRQAAKITTGRNLLRAEFPVRLTADGLTGTEIDLRSEEVGADHFKNEPPREAVKRLDDPVLGSLVALTPKSPFGDPWFEIRPRPGFRVFAPDAQGSVARRGVYVGGGAAPFGGVLGRVWALIVPEAELSGKTANEAVIGTLVVYQVSRAGADQFSARLSEVLQTKLTAKLAAARASLQNATTATTASSAPGALREPPPRDDASAPIPQRTLSSGRGSEGPPPPRSNDDRAAGGTGRAAAPTRSGAPTGASPSRSTPTPSTDPEQRPRGAPPRDRSSSPTTGADGPPPPPPPRRRS
ncbi:hypothetical protein [Agromyces sp. Marseille-Q5079]|uniref:hypothetical protein n=1 Tax=Agromyces sp. Marseille-Q5079 TaxID=3439059 RepID=UPI003D9C95C7